MQYGTKSRPQRVALQVEALLWKTILLQDTLTGGNK